MHNNNNKNNNCSDISNRDNSMQHRKFLAITQKEHKVGIAGKRRKAQYTDTHTRLLNYLKTHIRVQKKNKQLTHSFMHLKARMYCYMQLKAAYNHRNTQPLCLPWSECHAMTFV